MIFRMTLTSAVALQSISLLPNAQHDFYCFMKVSSFLVVRSLSFSFTDIYGCNWPGLRIPWFIRGFDAADADGMRPWKTIGDLLLQRCCDCQRLDGLLDLCALQLAVRFQTIQAFARWTVPDGCSTGVSEGLRSLLRMRVSHESIASTAGSLFNQSFPYWAGQDRHSKICNL